MAALVSVTQYNAETAHPWRGRARHGEEARTDQEDSLAAADDALELVKSIELPDGGVSTLYADMPSLEGSAATDTTPAVKARPGHAELIAAVTQAQAVVRDVQVEDECTDRDQAVAITDASADAYITVADLDEAARIAAEKNAAEEAAQPMLRRPSASVRPRRTTSTTEATMATVAETTVVAARSSPNGGGGYPRAPYSSAKGPRDRVGR